jgi:hypothetical protein
MRVEPRNPGAARAPFAMECCWPLWPGLQPHLAPQVRAYVKNLGRAYYGLLKEGAYSRYLLRVLEVPYLLEHGPGSRIGLGFELALEQVGQLLVDPERLSPFAGPRMA